MYHCEAPNSGIFNNRNNISKQVKGLFKGMMYPMVSAGLLNSLFFGVYGVSLRAMTSLRGEGAKPNYLEIYLAGCAGGVAQEPRL